MGKTEEEKKAYRKAYYLKNKKYILERQKRYYKDNKEVSLEAQRKWREKNTMALHIYSKNYYEKNRGKIYNYQRKYYDKNIEKRRKYTRDYYQKNKIKIQKKRKLDKDLKSMTKKKLIILKKNITLNIHPETTQPIHLCNNNIDTVDISLLEDGNFDIPNKISCTQPIHTNDVSTPI